MNLTPYDFEKAPEGAIFVKKGEHLVATTFDELAKDLKTEVKKIGNLEHKIEVANKNITKLQNASKKHFIIVFTLFELKALKGEIDVEDENLLNLDQEVISGRLSVERAINKHEYLKNTYNALFESEDK